MKVKFRKSETQREHIVKLQAEGYYILDSHPNNWSEDCFVAVRKSAVDVVPNEPTYKIGQRFRVSMGGECILAQVDASKVTFIGLKNGNYWNTPIQVKNCERVTVSDLNKLAHDWCLI